LSLWELDFGRLDYNLLRKIQLKTARENACEHLIPNLSTDKYMNQETRIDVHKYAAKRNAMFGKFFGIEIYSVEAKEQRTR
jgi:hypothetical protein